MVTPKQISYPEPFFSLGLEKNFKVLETLEWMNTNWHIPYLIVLILYLPMIYLGPIIMKNREPMNVRIPLMLWNTGLGIFSILGFIHVLPEAIYGLNNYGLKHTVCNASFIHHKSAAYWHYLFTLSKIPELVDTLFLVLTKKKVIFLHAYHHAIVPPLGWIHYAHLVPVSRWYNTMNYGIHSIMYSYYALKTMPHIFKIPRWVSMFITSLQTVQMVFGLSFVLASGYYKAQAGNCDCAWPLIIIGITIYASFFFLFSKFFYDSYVNKSPKAIPVTEKKRA